MKMVIQIFKKAKAWKKDLEPPKLGTNIAMWNDKTGMSFQRQDIQMREYQVRQWSLALNGCLYRRW